jgi:Protein of unknown function (DUF3140)
MSDDDVRREFDASVNMTRRELERWLDSDESKSVGVRAGTRKTDASGGESVGHESGRRILTILGKKKDELDGDDVAHMRKVNGYVKRHLAQRPEKEPLEDSRWRRSLMNWGHDPLKG